jgi:mono/diheme cytochrome c family protein
MIISPRFSLWCLSMAVALMLASHNGLAGEYGSSSAAAAKADGSVYKGWRLFQAKCATCHGRDATGTTRAPDLLPRVKEMNESKFVETVLRRYTWLVPSSEAASETGSREAMVEQVLQGKKGVTAMPSWEGEPSVNASILDLYKYLRARGDGTQGPERPKR